MAAVCALHECGDDMDKAKTFCLGYVDKILSLPEVESYIDIKYSSQKGIIDKLKGITEIIKGLFNKSDCDDVLDQVFSCNRSLHSYLGGTGVDWQVIIGPNAKGSISEGDTCKCDTSGNEERQKMTSDLPQSTGVFQNGGRDGSQPSAARFCVAGDRGYKIVVSVCDSGYDGLHRIERILVTSPQSEDSSLDIRGMECVYRYITAAIHNYLLLWCTEFDCYLYDIRSGKRLWRDF